MNRSLPHLRVLLGASAIPYSARGGGGRRTFPDRDRAQHAQILREDLNRALLMYQQLKAVEPELPGMYLEFTAVGADPPLGSLEQLNRGIELCYVREILREGAEPLWEATVYIPDAYQTHHLNKVEAYATSETPQGQPKNAPLVTHLEGGRLASVQSLFADDLSELSETEATRWWEVWLTLAGVERFSTLCQQLEVNLSEDWLEFPEHHIVMVNTTLPQLERLIRLSGAVRELHTPSRFPSDFLELSEEEEYAEMTAVLERVQLEPSTPAVDVCILDTGVNFAHPLLESALPLSSCLTVDPAWGVADVQGHGTGMAGLALFGDLHPVLNGTHSIVLKHELTSVKVLPDSGSNSTRIYGRVMVDAVSLTEIEHPFRKHVYCLAITDRRLGRRSAGVSTGSTGRPTTWSGALDQLAWDDETHQRLFVASAGNIPQGDLGPKVYWVLNDVSWVQSPAQAFNILTVGAYTEKVQLSPGYRRSWTPIGHKADLSPVSRTSVGWKDRWPIKPDIVFEGGNHAHDSISTVAHDDLRLLTTAASSRLRLFGDTSASSALAARMAAQIWAERPTYWPETVRGLIVHSAEWTQAMRGHLHTPGLTPTQAKTLLLRRYGHGVPQLERALYSDQNDFTLVFENSLRPFKRRASGGKVDYNEMHFIELPWPIALLEQLGNTPLQLRVTLSYFIEPNLGSKGVITSKHNYISHGLRFDIRRPGESVEAFRRRINLGLREEENQESAVSGDSWDLGGVSRKGTIQSDFWTADTPADMARRTQIAVFPTNGWWRLKPRLERYDQDVRYSLLVSLSAPQTQVDLYSAVVKVMNPIITPTTITV